MAQGSSARPPGTSVRQIYRFVPTDYVLCIGPKALVSLASAVFYTCIVVLTSSGVLYLE